MIFFGKFRVVITKESRVRGLHTIEINLQALGTLISEPGQPIQVCISYTSGDLNQSGGNPNRFVLGTVPSDGTEWVMLNTTENTANKQVCANVSHFYLFDVFINPSPETERDNKSGSSGVGTASQLPARGFTPNKVTTLSIQPADNEYITYMRLKWDEEDTSPAAASINLEIPSLQMNRPIIGVPLENGKWD